VLRKLDYAIIAVLAVALTYFVVDKFWISKRIALVSPTTVVVPASVVSTPRSPVIPEKSLAVLPFVDMSGKQDQEYFSDGLSEELIDLLTRVPDLRVPARISSFHFMGSASEQASSRTFVEMRIQICDRSFRGLLWKLGTAKRDGNPISSL
jgi:hypothetical protein